MKKMNSIVIFDLDGTLVESRKDIVTSINLMRANFSLSPLSHETVTSYIGDGNRTLVEKAIINENININDAFQKFNSYYLEHLLDETRLYKGTIEALEKIKALGFNMAIVSNKNEEYTKIICEKLNILKYFNPIIGGDTYPEHKPSPFGLLKVIEISNSLKENSWMVGDSQSDIRAGINAEIKTCFCKFGFGKLTNHNYTIGVKCLLEFAEHLEGINE